LKRRTAKIIILAFALMDLLLVSGFSAVTILLLTIGTVLMISGRIIAYRPAAVIGLILAAIGSVINAEFGSLSEFNVLMGSILGLFIPVFILCWVALSSEEENDAFEFRPEKNAFFSTTVYASLCLASVPVVVLILSIFSPSISMRISMMAEIAIMLVAAIAGIMILTFQWKKPKIQENA